MKRWSSLFFVFSCLLFLGLWFHKVDPLPDKDSLLKLYWPVLQSLERAETESVFKVSVEEFQGDYPRGPALIPMVVQTLGLGSLFQDFPRLYFALPFFIFLTLLFAYPSRDKLIWAGLFFFPMTQICLKDYSPHSLILLLHLVGGFAFYRGLGGGAGKYLWGAAILLWYSMTLKHVGIVYFLAFLAAAFVSSYRRFSWRLWAGYGFLLLAALPFYPSSGSQRYWTSTKDHSYLSEFSWLWISLGAIFFLVSFLSFLRNRTVSNQVFPGSLILPATLLCTGLLWDSLSFVSSEYDALTRSIVLALLGMGVCLRLVRKWGLGDESTFLFLWPAFHFCIDLTLYSSWLARINHLILAPALVAFACASLRLSRERKSYFLMVAGLFAVSNFFPKQWLESRDSQWLGHTFVHNLFNGHHVNYLGWERCTVTQQRRKLKSILQRNFTFPRETEVTTIAMGFHPSREMLLHFPNGLEEGEARFTRIDDWPYERALSLRAELLGSGFVLEESLFRKYGIGLILISKDPLAKSEEIHFDLEETAKAEDFHPNQFLVAFKLRVSEEIKDANSALFRSLSNNTRIEISPELEALVIPVEEVAGELASSRQPSSSKADVNSQVQDDTGQVIEVSNREASERKGSSIEIRQRKAGELFLMSNKYFDSNPQKCMEILKEVLLLDPEHEEARKDLEVLQKMSGGLQ